MCQLLEFIIPILQMGKESLREEKSPADIYPATRVAVGIWTQVWLCSFPTHVRTLRGDKKQSDFRSTNELLATL